MNRFALTWRLPGRVSEPYVLDIDADDALYMATQTAVALAETGRCDVTLHVGEFEAIDAAQIEAAMRRLARVGAALEITAAMREAAG